MGPDGVEAGSRGEEESGALGMEVVKLTQLANGSNEEVCEGQPERATLANFYRKLWCQILQWGTQGRRRDRLEGGNQEPWNLRGQ